MKIIVIGGGPAGKTAAIEAAQIEEEVTLIEKKHLGGKCLNEGCMIVAGLNDVAKFVKDSQRYKELGITSQALDVNYEKLAEGIKNTIKKIITVHEAETREVDVEIIKGTATISKDEQSVTVNQKTLEYDKLIVATGSRAFIPPIKGTENAYTYSDVLDFKKIPKKLLIIGSSVIATEFAGIFSMMGSEVKILGKDPFLEMVDDDIRSYVARKLLDKVEIRENVQVKEITGNGIYLGEDFIEGDVLLATGMTPNSQIVEGIVDLGSHGEILVNRKMETSNENIYAAGDVVGGIGNTPVSRMEGIVAARNACGVFAEVDYSFIPNSISLYYDVAYITHGGDELKNMEGTANIKGSIPGYAGPGSFWRVLEGNTGFTKVKIDSDSGLIKDVSSISPTARTSMAYMAQMMKDEYKTYDFQDFRETHPSTDPVYKLLRFFAKFG